MAEMFQMVEELSGHVFRKYPYIILPLEETKVHLGEH